MNDFEQITERAKVDRWLDYHTNLGGEVWLVDWNTKRYREIINKSDWISHAQGTISQHIKDLAKVKKELITGPHKTSNYDLYTALKRLWMMDQDIWYTSASRWEPWRERTRLHPGQSRVIARVLQNKPAYSIHFVYEHGMGKGFWDPVKQLNRGDEVWNNLSYGNREPEGLRFATMNVPDIQKMDGTIDHTKYTKPWIYFDWIHGDSLKESRNLLSNSIL